MEQKINYQIMLFRKIILEKDGFPQLSFKLSALMNRTANTPFFVDWHFTMHSIN